MLLQKKKLEISAENSASTSELTLDGMPQHIEEKPKIQSNALDSSHETEQKSFKTVPAGPFRKHFHL